MNAFIHIIRFAIAYFFAVLLIAVLLYAGVLDDDDALTQAFFATVLVSPVFALPSYLCLFLIRRRRYLSLILTVVSVLIAFNFLIVWLLSPANL